MAERFGSQAHPSGGLRFGSQTYAAINAAAGELHATESGGDVLAASSYPRVNGVLAVSESGSDALVAAGISSLLFTMQAHETPTPDTFVSSGRIINASLRFGSQVHPSGGLRFGAQSWAPLGPSGSLVATEAGSDGLAAAGFFLGESYSFAAFDILDSFVNYSGESVGSAITGTLDTGNKVLLPVSTPGGIAFTWETNEFGNPSLRLANLVGARIVNNVPWYVWNGTSWTAATFSVSDAMQGAAFLTEVGLDIFSANAAQTRYGSLSVVEEDDDALLVLGAVAVRGTLSTAEPGADSFVATGQPHYVGELAAEEGSEDSVSVTGAVVITSSIALVEASAADAFVAAGRLISAGTLAANESGADMLSASGMLTNTGALAATEQIVLDTVAATGALRITGMLHATETGGDVLSVAGRLDRAGSVTLTEAGSDAVAFIGVVRVSGALAATDLPDTFAATGTRESTGSVVAAELAALEGGADRFVSRGRFGDVVPLPTFDGPIGTESGTRMVAIRSRRTAEAA